MLFTMSCLCGMMCDVSRWLGELIMAAIIFLTPKHWTTVNDATHIFIIPLMDSVGPTESTLSHSDTSIWEETPTRRDTSLVRRRLSVKFLFCYPVLCPRLRVWNHHSTLLCTEARKDFWHIPTDAREGKKKRNQYCTCRSRRGHWSSMPWQHLILQWNQYLDKL